MFNLRTSMRKASPTTTSLRREDVRWHHGPFLRTHLARALSRPGSQWETRGPPYSEVI